jgi:formamidopyrimidine-DNA glycosylase
MPELPEVETVRRGLLPVMEGVKITDVAVHRPNLRWALPENMANRLTGATVTALRRRSKYILADLDSGETLIIHLGMSGRMLISGVVVGEFVHEHPAPQKHDHVVLNMENGARVTFNDARRFGHMDLGETATLENHWLVSSIGPEPFGNAFNGSYLVQAIKKRASPIKTVLLDQCVVAGLGNIYVCEVLHRAKISPTRRASNLSKKRIESLVPIIRDVLSEAIEAGGSSLRDYRQADGELGYFQHTFRVYGREDAFCVTDQCTGKIIRIVQSGRSSFYCPKCQR